MNISGSEDTEAFFNRLKLYDALYTRSRQNAVLVMNRQGILADANHHFLRSFGYEIEDIIGQQHTMLFTPEDIQYGLPEKELEKVTATGQSHDNNYLLNKDKTRTWVSGESLLVSHEDGQQIIVKIIQNIQEIKASEASLQMLNEFNENILSSIEDVVIVLDQETNILKSNKDLSSIFHLQNDQIPENFGWLLKQYNSDSKVLKQIRDCLNNTGGFNKCEIEIESADGNKHVYIISCRPLTNKHKGHVLVVIHDITEQKHAEREREDIIGFVAHELRNPLANIVLSHELLSDAIEQNNLAEMRDMLQRSKNNLMRINKMTAELYEATKANAGNLTLTMQPFNFQDMIKESVDTIHALQPYYNIIISGNSDITVYGDRFRLMQVVTNFLSNGIKYSNGATIVLLSVQHNEDHVTVSVKDEGLGISPEQLPHIFERFFRAERTRNLEGIGLGLYLCRQIIQEHHGRIWAESEEGKGSSFFFTIPLNH